jgi:hypothetical protein
MDTSAASAKLLPLVGQTPVSFGSLEFETGPGAPDRAGIFVLWQNVDGYVRPIYIGEGESIVNAIATVRAVDGDVDRETQGAYWMALPFAAERTRLVRELNATFTPKYGVEPPAPVVKSPVITLPVVKLPNLPATADLPTTIAARKAALESEIAQLVSRY